MTPRIGSLFSGTGALDHAVQQTIGGEPAWHADIDPGARKLLAQRAVAALDVLLARAFGGLIGGAA